MHARDLNLQFSHHEATSLLVPRHNFKSRCFKQCKKYPRQGPSPSCRQNHDSPRRRKSSKDPPSVPLLECGIPQYLSMYRSLPTNLSPEPIGATIAPTGSHRSAPTADPYRTHTKTHQPYLKRLHARSSPRPRPVRFLSSQVAAGIIPHEPLGP
jgi:hypothetical protein